MGKYKFGIMLAVILGLRLISEILVLIVSYGSGGSGPLTSIVVAILYLAALLGAISHNKTGIIVALILVILDLLGSIGNFSSLATIGMFNFVLDLVMLILVYFAYKEIKPIVTLSTANPKP